VTVLTTPKRDDQQGPAVEPQDFDVVTVPYRAPRVLEGLRARHRTRAGSAGGACGGRGGFLSRLRDRRGLFGALRMPDLTDFWVRPAVRWARGHGPWDVVVSSAGPYTAHLVALAVRREGWAARWVADYRDLWTDSTIFPGLFPFTVYERRLERRCLQTADLVVTVSEGLARRLAARTATPVEVIYNGFEASELNELPALPDDGHTRIVFTGTVYPSAQDLAPLFSSLAVLRAEAPAAGNRLRVAVAGDREAYWVGAAEQAGVLDLLEHRGVVPRGEARRMQRDADALLLVDFEPRHEGMLTGKAFEYLDVTAPIIVIGGRPDSAIAGLMKRTGRGVHLGTDQGHIVEALRALAEGRPVLTEAPNRDVIDSLTRHRQALRLRKRLSALIG
jgi:hypothetical protein